jgi:hypothetical protein
MKRATLVLGILPKRGQHTRIVQCVSYGRGRLADAIDTEPRVRQCVLCGALPDAGRWRYEAETVSPASPPALDDAAAFLPDFREARPSIRIGGPAAFGARIAGPLLQGFPPRPFVSDAQLERRYIE